MHIHILGICGTFMGSLAQLAKSLGHRVTGSDANVYPPMSTQLQAAGIDLIEGFDVAQLKPQPDLVVIGNAMSRGNPVVEEVLDRGLAYTSGPQWLCDYLLQDKWVLAVSGTHGKTTTASMLTWVLEFADMEPGYLIGGVPKNFDTSARLGGSPFFVVEADEYDSAFFDKRSKFVHYRPRTLIINNMEYDHADIFPDLAAIQTQFHHVVRTVPGNGLVVCPQGDKAIAATLERGCWTPQETLGIEGQCAQDTTWQARLSSDDGSGFEILHRGQSAGEVSWGHTGLHNVCNALAAVAAARNVGVIPELSVQALCAFEGVKRRMECLGSVGGIKVYDDFAHHPTAIATTLEGLRAKVGEEPILALIEPRSNTMRMGIHRETLAQSTAAADQVIWYQPPGVNWDLGYLQEQSPVPAQVLGDMEQLLSACLGSSDRGSESVAHIVIMSNGGFGGVHQKLLQALRSRADKGAHHG
ncbi:UDP-N-acetylmuramate:L-alanyl-gamma-D-glutamyl-meso-diaminopimelate ligase [Pseudomaricurvus alkylphenolicus]|uniref:UDP-N-acetylmuramate:L-alanyl-gamma-D-glutamyl- meso-diaminopimelate ligase n=1 Tax=Pseudomaricurvus alkylphenolicus TaxID=1306991 RepID=UPI001421886D|nr:UDP-N-acetylmuramate:L-alanyl-gamma-D-glutamyl-meso-diaminopimelate ligase [Pseudomaricurvus alkylphenolicus]NIB41803.1 UDP-N-acetylmuramate:L-alanyl-gamma-D-glutamyl-meso-diaminopimelate ligase [Pseudomaricurvus alkylphenolicus]